MILDTILTALEAEHRKIASAIAAIRRRHGDYVTSTPHDSISGK